MSAESNRQPTAIDELRELVRKSVQANATLAERGAELLKEVSRQNLGLPDLSSRGSEVLKRAFDQYVRMSSAYTSSLIDLGLDASQHMLDTVRSPGSSGRPAAEPEPASGPLFDLAVSGKPGDTCQTAVILESDRPEGYDARFVSSEVTDSEGKARRGFKIEFEPESKHVTKKEQFVVRVTIPRRIRPGAYYAVISLKGQTGRFFRLIIEVERALSAEQAAEAPGKRRTQRRPRKSKGNRTTGDET